MDMFRRKLNATNIIQPPNHGPDRNIYPTFNKLCSSLQPMHFQHKDGYIPIQIQQRPPLYSLEQNRTSSPQIVLQDRHDVEYITVPVLKTFKTDPRLNMYQQDNTAMELASKFPNSYYFFTSQQMKMPMMQPEVTAFQPPPRSNGREPTKTCMPNYGIIEKGGIPTKHDNFFIPKNITTNNPELRMANNFHGITHQHSGFEAPSPCRSSLEEEHSVCPSCHTTFNNRLTSEEEQRYSDLCKRKQELDNSNDIFDQNLSFIDLNRNISERTNRENKDMTLDSGCYPPCLDTASLEEQTDISYITDESTFSYSSRSSTKKTKRSSKLRKIKSTRIKKRKVIYKSTGTQTEKNCDLIDERHLMRETIMNGCQEIMKLATKYPQAIEIIKISEKIREKTIQLRARDYLYETTTKQRLDPLIIVTEHTKAFLSVADCWLQTQNLCIIFERYYYWSKLFDDSLFFSIYMELKIACRKFMQCLMSNIQILGSQTLEMDLRTTEAATDEPRKLDCRLTKSSSYLPNNATAVSRLKWTITDKNNSSRQNIEKTYADTLKESKQGSRTPYSQTDVKKVNNLPKEKFTLLSQIEPQFLRNQGDNNMSVDISSWFSEKNTQRQKEQNNTTPQKSYSSSIIKADSSLESADEEQQKVYMKPGSYNVPRKNLTEAFKRNIISKAKETCYQDSAIKKGYVISLSNSALTNRGLTNKGQIEPSIKILKKDSTLNPISETNDKYIKAEKDENKFDLENKNVMKNKSMKTDKWLMTTLLNANILKQELNNKETSETQILNSKVDNDKNNKKSDLNKIKPKGKIIKNGRNVWNNSKRQSYLTDKVNTQLNDILMKLWNLDNVEIMKNETESCEISEYCKVTLNPIFLEQIVEKLKDGAYDRIEQFVFDCRHMVLDTINFYKQRDKSQLKKIATFSELFEKLLQENFGNTWGYIRGTCEDLESNQASSQILNKHN